MVDTPLFFLPGFMGHSNDFGQLVGALDDHAQLSDWHWPVPTESMTFREYAVFSWQMFRDDLPEYFYLYGYSMGGRMLMAWLELEEVRLRCLGVFIASAHPGLCLPAEQKARYEHDHHWATLFRTLPMHEVLTAWYNQGIFATLTDETKHLQIKAKLQGTSEDYARVLEVASLSQQPDLRSPVLNFPNFRYLVGRNDQKFFEVATAFVPTEKLSTIENAGHLLHVEQPFQLAEIVSEQIKHWR